MNQSISYELDAVMPAAIDTGLFSNVVTFKDRPGGAAGQVNATGQVDLETADFTNVVGLVDIPCMFAVISPYRPDRNGGARMPDYFVESQNRHMLLNGYYPQVLQRYIAVIEGDIDPLTGQPTVYEITPGSVEHDSQHRETRLAVRKYNY